MSSEHRSKRKSNDKGSMPGGGVPSCLLGVGLTALTFSCAAGPRVEAAAARCLPHIPLDSDTRTASTVTHVTLALRDGGVGGGPRSVQREVGRRSSSAVSSSQPRCFVFYFLRFRYVVFEFQLQLLGTVHACRENLLDCQLCAGPELLCFTQKVVEQS